MSSLWPHQDRAIAAVESAIAGGQRRLLLAAPTGAGKTRIMLELCQRWLDQGLKVTLYTNRRLLLDQTAGVLEKAGLAHGIRAAGHDNTDGQFENLQICSLQTEVSRSLKKKTWELTDAQRVLVDEAHVMRSGSMTQILERHHQAGAAVVGVTATPLNLAHLYDHLIVAAVTSECHACGALVPAWHYGCDEPDLRHIGKVPVGEDLSEAQNVKAIMVHGVFGRVLDWYRKLNPQGHPTVLFAPGVAESIWFAEQFQAAGIPAAHLDGADIWLEGTVYRTRSDLRAQVLAWSQSGHLKVLCNRFVLREGIDMPWVRHGILASVFGSLQSYLQAGGRMLRAAPGKTEAVIQDHGGNWHRHGSLNADRHWELNWDGRILSFLRQESFRNHEQPEPFLCPQCNRVLRGRLCPCGFQVDYHKRSRPVVQKDGTLKHMTGDIYRPRRINQAPNAVAVWIKMLHRSRQAGRTYLAAEALYAAENNWAWPDRTWPGMPRQTIDLVRVVGSVPAEQLHDGGGL